MSDPLIELAQAVGIQPTYVDMWGQRRDAAPGVLSAILDAMGLGGDSAQALAAYRCRTAAQLMAPAVILRHGRPAEAVLTLPSGRDDNLIAMHLRLEAGNETSWGLRIGELVLHGRLEIEGVGYEHRLLPLPDNLPMGYHRLHIELGERPADALIIVAPERVWSGWCGPADRYWGIAVQLYAVRSSRNWGIGDFTDLAELMERAAREGAAVIGVNPLHALYPDEPERASPYSPSTRLYANPLYLDVEAIPDFASCSDARALVTSAACQRELEELRATPTVAYIRVALLKLSILRLLHANFGRSATLERRRAFAQFCDAEGTSLRRFAIYERLREVRSAGDLSQRDWRNWPPELQNPDSPAIAEFAKQEAFAIEFVEYLQWQVAEQLGSCARRGESLGMPIGLYVDLAAGVDAGGAEAWWNQEVVVRGLAIGAPPDVLNSQGQDWGLPLFNPVRLAEQAFEPFISVLRANMRHAGGIRIDHIFGLMRLWCVPEGNRPANGAYLAYPVENLLAIVALESHRHRCLIIGEDLGTMPPGMDKILADAEILSYRVLYFERSGDAFRRTADYLRNALVTVGTHDLPPLARWWHCDDLTLRTSLGMMAPEQLESERAHRVRECRALTAWAGVEGVSDEPPVVAIHHTLACAPSRLLMVQFEDSLPGAQQINVPGTTKQYPNWHQKLDLNLIEMFNDRLVRETLRAVAAERP